MRWRETIFFAAFLPAIAMPVAARAQVRAAHLCATQTASQAAERISACSTILNSGRLRGKPAGVAYGLRGLAFLDRGDIPHAIADFNQAIALAPDFVPAYQNRGNAWYARGNYGDAIADYDAAIRLDPNSPSAYVSRATVRRDLGFFDGAMEDYLRAISLDAEKASAFSGRGQLLASAHDYAAALADFDHALKLDPSISNYMLRAQAREASSDANRALADYAEATRLDPKNVAAFTAEAAIWRKAGDNDKAIAAYDRALSIEERAPATLKLRARAYAAKGDRKSAIADINRSLKYAWDVGTLQERGDLRLDDSDLRGAIQDADVILKANPNSAAALSLRGVALTRSKAYERALPDLDRALAQKADDNRALAARAQIRVSQGNSDGAVADYDAAIKLAPTDASLLRDRGAVRLAMNNYSGAIEDFDRAIGLDSANAQAYYQRALAYEKSNEQGQAMADYKAALERDGHLTDARAALARLTAEQEHQSRDAARQAKAVTDKQPVKPEVNKPDVTASLPSVDRKGPTSEQKTVAHISKVQKPPVQAHQAHPKIEHKLHRTAHHEYARRVERPRYYRAGSSSDTRFTEIWTERR